MTPWAAFFPDVLPHVRGCPDPTVTQHLQRAAAEFFRRTRAWVEWLDAVTGDGDRTEIDLETPSGSTVVMLERVLVDEKPVAVASHRSMSLSTSEMDGDGVGSADRLSVVFAQAPADGAAVRIHVSLSPSRTSAGIPDDLFEHHADPIVAGALARLFALPKTEWADGQLAAYHSARFENFVGQRAYRAWRGETNVTPRPAARWF